MATPETQAPAPEAGKAEDTKPAETSTGTASTDTGTPHGTQAKPESPEKGADPSGKPAATWRSTTAKPEAELSGPDRTTRAAGPEAREPLATTIAAVPLPPPVTAPPYTIVAKVVVAAKPARVWKALTEPAELAKWLCRKATVEAKAGGKFLAEWQPGNASEGTVEEAVEGKSFRLLLPQPLGFQLEAEGDGRTRVETTIGPWPMTIALEQTVWSIQLLYLKAYLEHGVDLREPDAAKGQKDGYVNGFPEP